MHDWRDVTVWEELAGDSALAGLIEAAAATDPGDPAGVTRLRRFAGPGPRAAALASAALELAEARRKAARKFDDPARLWCDVAGVEQSSGTLVARWKAGRIREALGGEAGIRNAGIHDLCTGIGGDAIELARAGLSVVAVDREPRRVFMATRNAGCVGRVGDVESIDPVGLVLHADPARRDECGARSWSLDDHRPGRAWIERALGSARAAAVKFSPGVDRHALPVPGVEWEYVEERGTLVQAIAWSGAFTRTPGMTRATILGVGEARSLVGMPVAPASAAWPEPRAIDPGSFVSEPTPALERAGLWASAIGDAAADIDTDADVWEIAPRLGLLASTVPLPPPWFESFRFVARVAARLDRVREVLDADGLSARSVRVRGRAVDADRWTRELGCAPSGRAVVFAYRLGGGAEALVTCSG